jgi:polar amino acid transport system substrate-binding protein
MIRRTALHLLAILATGPLLMPLAHAAPSPQEIAPTGALRVAVALSPAPGPFWAGRDAATGEPKGVTVDLGRAMAERLGVKLALVVLDNSGAITDAAAQDKWDVTFVPMDKARAEKLDFGPVYNIGESTFLVRPGAPISGLEDVDRPGVRVVGISNTTTIRAIGGWLKHTQAVGLPTVEAVIAQLKSGEADAFGMSRDSLDDLARDVPGSHVLPGYFFQARTAVAVPKGHAAALAFATSFVDEAKTSGLLRRILDRNGLEDQAVAPGTGP